MRTVSTLVTADATGTVTANLVPPPGYAWSVNHIAISSNSNTNSTCSIYKNSDFICGTNIGNGDSADGTPVPIRQGDTLSAIWKGISNKAVCKLLAIVDEVIAGAGRPVGSQ